MRFAYRSVIAVALATQLLGVAGCSPPSNTGIGPERPAMQEATGEGIIQPTATPTEAQSPAPPVNSGSQPAAAKPRPPKMAPPPLYPAYVAGPDGDRWGYINRDGKFVIPAVFEAAREFGPLGVAVVRQNGKYGLVDASGKMASVPPFSWVTDDLTGDPLVLQRFGSNSGDGQYTVVGANGAVLFSSPQPVDDFSEGLAAFRSAAGPAYGYLNWDGAVAIAPQFAQAERFHGGKAVVKKQDGKYAIIDKNGKELGAFSHTTVTNLAEDLAAFMDIANKKWGYISVAGEVQIPAQFSSARAFDGGFAVVGIGTDPQRGKLGVIGRDGQFVIPPEYGDIESLGNGLFAVAKSHPTIYQAQFLPKAILNREGRQLTDFLFFDVTRIAEGLLCVTDLHSTFIIDDSGRKAPGFPVLDGIGTLKLVGDLIQANIDGDTSYFTRDGKTVWQSDPSYTLTGTVRVTTLKHRPDRSTLVRYPQFSGLSDTKVEESLNTQVRQIFLGMQTLKGEPVTNPTASSTVTQTLDENANVSLMKNLLVVHRTSEQYGVGAAHGMPGSDYYHFDLTTGAQYHLSDLFKPGSKYTERLKDLIARQIAQKPDQNRFTTNPPVGADQHFAVQSGGLKIYYYPYEIAAYAAGFPEYLIPWDDIIDLINTDAPFWRAFH